MLNKNTPAPRERGRPRTFDRQIALSRAMVVFWERGFEGTSMEDLVKAMKISPSSLYAAFGDKKRLFEAVIDHYLAGPGGFIGPILQSEPSIKKAFERLMQAAAFELSRSDQPAGCMVSLAVTHCSPGASDVQAVLTKHRGRSLSFLQARLQEGILNGELPPDTDARELARFFMSILQGMSVQARDGAKHENLLATAAVAMRAWPGS